MDDYSWLLGELDKRYPPELASRLYEAFLRAFHRVNDSCIDNFRYARKDDFNEANEYGHRKNQGCCGFFDDEVTINGVEFLYGFNYGH